MPCIKNITDIYTHEYIEGMFLDEIWVIFEYSDIAEILKKWKYTEKGEISKILLSEYKKSVKTLIFPESNTHITAIPIGFDRYFERKFNQSNILVQEVKNVLKYPVFHFLFRFWS